MGVLYGNMKRFQYGHTIYWSCKLDTSKVTDIAILLIIDGLGAIVCSVILREGLKKTTLKKVQSQHYYYLIKLVVLYL